MIGALAAPFVSKNIDHVVGIESRGFILGAAVANHLKAGFVPIRKPGKLPSETHREDYALEYGTDGLEIHTDACREGQRILIVDDVLATGGTARAAAGLVQRVGGQLVGLSFLIELNLLKGREKLAGETVHSVLQY
jgi:adenine phosphoribosyltransferase